MPEPIDVLNPGSPDRPVRLDAARVRAVRAAILAALPEAAPGITFAEMKAAVAASLPELFPGGEKAGWWTKAVQLDLEARGEAVREASRPLRFRRA